VAGRPALDMSALDRELSALDEELAEASGAGSEDEPGDEPGDNPGDKPDDEPDDGSGPGISTPPAP